MTEHSKEMSRRDFLKAAALAASGVILGSKEVNAQEPVVRLTGVTFPLDTQRNVTASALAIALEKINLTPDQLEQITIIAREPKNVPGQWSMDAEQIGRQLDSEIVDPSRAKRMGNAVTSPDGIIYVPILGQAHVSTEEEINKLGIQTISARNELGEGPSTPRDFRSGTQFEIQIGAAGETRIFSFGI